MTAQVVELFPVAGRADDTIRKTIKALMNGKGISVEELAPRLNMAPATLYRRLAGRGTKAAFKAGEVASAARELGVTVEQLYSGLGGAFTPPDGPVVPAQGDAASWESEPYPTALISIAA